MCWKKVFAEVGFEMEDKEIVSRFGKSAVKILLEILPFRLHKEIRELTMRKRRCFIENQAKLKLFPGVKKVLEILKEKSIPIGLASSMDIISLGSSLRSLEVEAFFDVILSAENVEKSKPDPEILLKAARKLCEKPENCLMVGDSVYDVLAAQEAGMKIKVVANNSYQLEQIMKMNVEVLENITEVLDEL
jgi:HAD superfamily hydrolase (TIGR01509 family)